MEEVAPVAAEATEAAEVAAAVGEVAAVWAETAAASVEVELKCVATISMVGGRRALRARGDRTRREEGGIDE